MGWTYSSVGTVPALQVQAQLPVQKKKEKKSDCMSKDFEKKLVKISLPLYMVVQSSGPHKVFMSTLTF